MADVPAFSTFSAISELFVSAAVFYFFYQAIRRDNYRWGLLTITIAFETLVNITYMASRLSQHADSGVERPAWITALLAAHGILSLVMFLGLIVLVLVAFRRHKVEGDNFLRAQRPLSYAFLLLWTASVLSGELLYALQLGGALRL